jgi:hypothetical protein
LEFCLDPKRAATTPTFVVRVWDHAIPHQIENNPHMSFVSSEQEEANTMSKDQQDRRVLRRKIEGNGRRNNGEGKEIQLSLEPERSQGRGLAE